MATRDGQSSIQVGDITTCSICQETFKVPKALPCIHTFCLKCIEKYCEDKGQGEVTCPLCRKLFKVPPGGNVNLPTNFLILQLLHVKQLTSVTEMEAIISESTQKIRSQLKDDVDKLSASVLQKQECSRQLRIDGSLNVEKISKTESEVSHRYDQLISRMQSHKKELMKELKVFKEEILNEVERKKDEIERQIVITESLKSNCLEMINNEISSESPISITAYDLHARAEELMKTQDESDCHKLSEVDITFKASLSPADSAKNFFGVLVFRADRTTKNYQNVDFTKFLERSVTLVHVLPSTGEPVTGITVLGDEVFLVRNTSQVYVYNSDDLTFKRSITITGSGHIDGLASCSHYNCLYLSDPAQKIIYKYHLTRNGITRWRLDINTIESLSAVSTPVETMMNGECYKLSVNKCYNILATVLYINRIQEYTTHGNLIREIRLDSSIDHPHHCVQLSTGNYVVSHDEPEQCRVCIVDQSGQVIKSSYFGLGLGPVWSQSHLAVDIHDNVLITDYNSSRIQVLSSSLGHLGDLEIPGHQLEGPYILHYDQLNHLLYIGECLDNIEENGRMFVLEPTINHIN